MSRTTKIILLIGGTLVVACVLVCIALVLLIPRVASNAVSTDAGKAKQIASQIADYTLPPGYQEQMGMDFLLYKIVAIAPTNRRGVTIMFMQFNTATANREQMEQQMRQAFQNQIQSTGTFQDAGEQTVTIKGQPTILTVRESQSRTSTFRQATGVFSGKSGIVMVMVSGTVDEWDWNMLNNFLASIR